MNVTPEYGRVFGIRRRTAGIFVEYLWARERIEGEQKLRRQAIKRARTKGRKHFFE